MDVRIRRVNIGASWWMRPGWRVAISGAGALAVEALVTLARSHGLLVGLGAFAFVALLGLLLPVGRTISERVFLVGTSTLGWNFVLWWAPLPWDRITIVLALASGSCAGIWLWHMTSETVSCTSLLPRPAVVDLVPLVAGAVALVSVAPLYLHRDATSLLANLLPGWDHAAHFWMFSAIRQGGATLDVLQPPTGDTYLYAEYPQAFHATVASLASLGWPEPANDASNLLLIYGRSSVAVITAGTTVLTAGLTSLPGVRKRPRLAIPLGVLLASGFLLGPGLMLHLKGFTAFWFPCVLAACVPMLTVQWRTPRQTAHALATLGALLGVAHGWLPLLTLAAPILLTITPRLYRQRHGTSMRRWLALGVVATGALLGLARATSILSKVQVDALAIPGAIPATSLELNLLLIAASTAILFADRPRRSRACASGFPRSNRIGLQAALASGVISAIFIALVQHQHGAFPNYYFWKYLTGFQLFMFTLVATSIGSRNPTAKRAATLSGKRRGWLAVVSAVTAAAAIAVTAAPNGSPVEQSRVHMAAVAAKASAAGELLRATAVHGACGTRAFMVSGTSVNVMNGQGWFLALKNSWTAQGAMFPFRPTPDNISQQDRIEAATNWLADTDRCLVVAPDSWRDLSDALPPQQRARLLTW